PRVDGEQPDVDPEFGEQFEAAFDRGRRDQMLLDHVHLGIDNRAAVEGPDRKSDAQRFDQETHADGWPARCDGESDACLAKPAHRLYRALGQGFVLREKRAVDVGHDKRDAGHAAVPLAGFRSSWRKTSSTIFFTGALIDTVTGRSSAVGGSSVLNWLVSNPG